MVWSRLFNKEDKMANAFFKIDFPGNEPVKGYAPGSDEKKSLKKTLGDLKGHVEDTCRSTRSNTT